MNKRSRAGSDAYYSEAQSWASDRESELRKSRALAWKVAAGAAAIALVQAGVLMILMPLKKEVPYMMLVDRHTGYVQALDPLDQERLAADTALTQSFLAQYVVARESFDLPTLQSDYRKVALWSADKARSDYLAAMQPTNPQSPLSRYPRDAVVQARVKSVSPMGPNLAMVRFETGLQSPAAGDAFTPLGSWVAMIRYRYSGEPMSIEDRLVNPLGFQVVSYRKDAEAVLPNSNAEPRPGTAPAFARPPAEAPAQRGAASPGPAAAEMRGGASATPAQQQPQPDSDGIVL